MAFNSNLPTVNNNGVAIVDAIEQLYDQTGGGFVVTASRRTILGNGANVSDACTTLDAAIAAYIAGSDNCTVSYGGLIYNGATYDATAHVTKW